MNAFLLELSRWKRRKLSPRHAGSVALDVQRFIPTPDAPGTFTIELFKPPSQFYRDYKILSIARDGEGREPLWGLYAPGDFWPLDWSTKAIYHVNKLEP